MEGYLLRQFLTRFFYYTFLTIFAGIMVNKCVAYGCKTGYLSTRKDNQKRSFFSISVR